MTQNFRGRAASIALFAAALVCAGPLAAQMRAKFDLPSQSLADSLRAIASQTNTNVLFDRELVNGHTAPAVKAELTAEQAVTRVLQGTGITVKTIDEKTVAIIVTPAAPPASSRVPTADVNSGERGDSWPNRLRPADSEQPAREGGSFWDRFRLAQADAAAGDVKPEHSAGRVDSAVKLEEVVVTAQKREERLQDVPVPVTAISGAALVDSNQLRIQDYFSKIPGLSVTSDGLFGSQSLTIRGITTGAGANPTVGVVVDDVPYGGSSTITQSDNIPDLDPGDLARVEVLRGPQGTLYGASSMGGLLKFVTVEPSTDVVFGQLQAGTSGVFNGTGLGYNVRGSINVPVNDTFAFRASGFTRDEPGYIDDPTHHSEAVNEERVHGGRLSALWRSSEKFSLKLSALYQTDKADGSSDVDMLPGLGDLQQSRLRGTGGFDKKLQAYSATLDAKLGSADLTALSGYNVNDVTSVFDGTYSFGENYTLPAFGVTGTPEPYHNRTKKVNQEVRVSFPLGQKLDWVWGTFYTHEENDLTEQFLAVDPATNALVSSWFNASASATYTEYAAFTNLAWHFTDRFDIQIGARESQIRGSFQEIDTGRLDLFFETSPAITPEANSRKYAFTYLLTPQFRVTPDLMVYARLASGYRTGGPNNGAAAFGLPPGYAPDKTQNYEIGVKGDFLEHSLAIDASLYYIDWKDIQVAGFDPNAGIGYTVNANRAKSQGVEISIESRPLSGLTLSGWVAWDDAVLTEPFPPTAFAFGAVGDRLPSSSRFSGNLSLEQRFPLTVRASGFIGASLSYTGDREGVFASSFDPTHQRQVYPAYAKTDLRAGARFDAWTVNIFANNVTDRRGVLAGGLGYSLPFAFSYIQPRTVGLSLSRTF
jgi:iron complex outermembrane receptor protein